MVGYEVELGRQRRVGYLKLLGFGNNLICNGLVALPHCLSVAIYRKASGGGGNERK